MVPSCIDVCSYQGIIDWAKVQKAGVEYAILRSIRKGLRVDPHFERNYKGAKKAGLKVGVYLYSYATTPTYAMAEATALVKLLSGRGLDLPVWLDLEAAELRKASADTVQAVANAFRQAITKAGYQCGIYCDADFYAAKNHFKGWAPDVPFWIASYGANDGKQHGVPAIAHHLYGHQYSSRCRVAGVAGFVDGSKIYGPAKAKAKTTTAGNPYKEPAKTVTSDAQAKAKGLREWISAGEGVRWVQWHLRRLGYDLGSSGVDGQCGAKTVAAITAAQKALKLTADGLCGPKTREALRGAKTPTAAKPPHLVTHKSVNNTLTPSSVTLDGVTAPVWAQGKWAGAYPARIHANGCGYCCAATAGRLRGKDLNPGALYSKALKLWKKPKVGQHHFISCRGIVALLGTYGIKATYLATTAATMEDVKKRIKAALKAGKPVICWCHKYAGADNPFTSGNHYVLAVGYDKDGKIIVANSSGGKIQRTTLENLTAALHRSATGKAGTWGTTVPASAGIVIVG